VSPTVVQSFDTARITGGMGDRRGKRQRKEEDGIVEDAFLE
jgi:hypothetical protein